MTQPLAVDCPATQNGQYQCNTATAQLTFPVATVSGGSGTVNAVQYSATGSTFGAAVNNQVTGTFPTSSQFSQVTASVTDSAGGSAQCTFFVLLTQGNSCYTIALCIYFCSSYVTRILRVKGGEVGSKMSIGYCVNKQLR